MLSIRDYLNLKRIYEYISDERDREIIILKKVIQKQDTEINKLNNVIDRMAGLFCKISKGEYVTIEANIEKDKIIEYFMKEKYKNDKRGIL